MTKDEALRLALEALKFDRAWLETDAPKMAWDKNNEAITAIREALAQPEQEPVAWMHPEAYKTHFTTVPSPDMIENGYWQPLYTSPPHRKPLTDEEIGLLTTGNGWSHLETPALAKFARAIEAAHGIKE